MEQQVKDNLEAAAAVIDQVFSIDYTVTLDSGRVVTVTKIRMKHNAFMLRLIIKAIDALGLDRKGNLSIDLNDTVGLLRLIAKFPDDINELIALLSDLTTEEVGELDTADGLAVLVKVIAVNRDFFTEKVAPMVAGLGIKKKVAA